MTAAGALELSRPVAVEEVLAEGGRSVTITADADERAALARRFDLIAIDDLTADVRLRPTVTGELDVSIDLTAAVVQRCVVTLVPVQGTVDERFVLRFSREADLSEEDVGGPDDPLIEAWPGAELDLGELVAQHFSLALNPYPRAPGAELPADYRDANGADGGPFAVLREIRDKLPDA